MPKTKITQQLKTTLQNLFSTQKLAVLSTSDKGKPYSSLIAFLSSDDLKSIFFATTRSTRKFANLDSQPEASILIDNRTNSEEDFHEGIAVTILGKAEEIFDEEREQFQEKFLGKYPYLKEFITAPTCALLKMEVRQYNIVSRFQNVMIMDVME